MTTNPGPTERAQEAASTAAEEGRHVAGVAKEEARNVASTATDQARNLANETMTKVTGQLGDQATAQRDRVVQTLQAFSEDVERMSSQAGGSGMATDLAREVATRSRSLASHLDGREPGRLLDDARDLARRRPGTFLLGALAAGVVAGRLVRAAADGTKAAAVAANPPTAQDDQMSGGPTVSSGPGVMGAPVPTNPPMPSAAPGQPTIETPGGSS